MNKNKDIKIFWDNQAKSYGNSSLATMPDQFLKDLEVENIVRYLVPGSYVADIGCGNGYSSFRYAKSMDVRIYGIDYSQAMIEVARQTLEKTPLEVRKRLTFSVGDVTQIGFGSSRFDIVMTDRCLINLTTRHEQATALQEIHRILKKGGLYLMCEDTEQGLTNLNSVREYVGLPVIPVRWHNLYVDERHIKNSIKDFFRLEEVIKFSSFYYLASRVINAKIAQDGGVEPSYDNEINRVAALCSSMNCFGDFGPLKLFVLRKV